MSKTNYEQKGRSSDNNSTSLNSLSFELFDQTPDSGFRALLAPHTPGGTTPEQHSAAGNAILDYIKHHENGADLDVPKASIASSMFSLSFHAFQQYALCNNTEKMSECIQQATEQFNKMSTAEAESLRLLYGPTVLPYLQATLIFVDNTIPIEHKQQQLNSKLEEIRQVSINLYPVSNVVYFAGRVFDMVNNPGMSYSSLFDLPTKFPPLPGETEWVKSNSYEQHMRYLGDLQSKEPHHATPIGETPTQHQNTPALMQAQDTAVIHEFSNVDIKKPETLHDKISTLNIDTVLNEKEYGAIVHDIAVLPSSEKDMILEDLLSPNI